MNSGTGQWSPSGQYCVGVHLDVSGIHCTSALTILEWLFVIYSISVDHRLLYVFTYCNTASSHIVRLILCNDHRTFFFCIYWYRGFSAFMSYGS